MPKNLLLLLLLSFSGIAQPDPHAIDSLKKALAGHPNAAQEAALLSDLTLRYKAISTDSALHYANSAVALSHKAPGWEDDLMAYSNLAGVYVARHEFQDAFINYRKAFYLASRRKNRDGLAFLNWHLGDLYLEMHKSDSAISCYHAAMFHYEASKNIQYADSVNNRIAAFYEQSQNFDVAREYYQKVLAYRQDSGKEVPIAKAYVSLANVLRFLNIPVAIDNYKSAIEILEKHKDGTALYDAYYRLGGLYFSLRKNDQAIEVLTRGKALFAGRKPSADLGNIDFLLAKTYSARKRYKEAADLYLEGIGVMLSCDNEPAVFNAYLDLALVYKLAGMYDNAQYCLTQYRSHIDKEIEEEVAKRTAVLEADYLGKKKAMELSENHSDAASHNLLIALMMLLILFIIMMYYFLHQQQKLMRRQKELEQLGESAAEGVRMLPDERRLNQEKEEIALKLSEKIFPENADAKWSKSR